MVTFYTIRFPYIKEEIEQIITDFFIYNNHSHNIVLLYHKFHCKLNHIEYFWCYSKSYARHFCKYNLEKLPIWVPKALLSIANSTILGKYKCCREKIVLYRAGIEYGSLEWRNKTLH